MTGERPKLKVFLDAGVPDSVGEIFRQGGHEVLLHRDHLPEKSPDQLVCAVSELNDCILVAFDGDMRQIAKQHGISGGRFRSLNLIKLSCFEPHAAKRVAAAMSLLEHEWDYGTKSGATRTLFVEILDNVIRTVR